MTLEDLEEFRGVLANARRMSCPVSYLLGWLETRIALEEQRLAALAKDVSS